MKKIVIVERLNCTRTGKDLIVVIVFVNINLAVHLDPQPSGGEVQKAVPMPHV